jgi:uncharacterized protein YdhG (YjbR/CyaY superfamily)
MSERAGDRADHFPAIEARHGRPVSTLLAELATLGDASYDRQMQHLRERYGLSRAHANAVVMYHRGSKTSRRYADPDAWFTSVEPAAAATARAVLAAITERFPQLELVIAWNQPMLRVDGQYVFGLSASSRHLTLNPWSAHVLHRFAPELRGCGLNKRTFTVPIGWEIDAELLQRMVAARLAELAPTSSRP